MLLLLLLLGAQRQVSPRPEGEDQPPWIRKKRLDDWRLLGSVGKGSFGEVFLAQDTKGNRRALKVFYPFGDDRRTFDIEYDGMEQAQRLEEQPHLVPVESVVRSKYCIYYTMPLADALGDDPYAPYTLYNRMTKKDLAEEELLEIAAAVLEALAFLHGKGLVHRDVKPDNILRVNGVWRLGDLGSITVRRPRSFTGTPGFYPEKKNFRADAASDLYALGKTLYCAATGMKPEEYPLVPEPYDYDRYPYIRKLYRSAVEGKYKTAAEMRKDVEDVRLERTHRLKGITINLR